jgi:hypothetical protein
MIKRWPCHVMATRRQQRQTRPKGLNDKLSVDPAHRDDALMAVTSAEEIRATITLAGPWHTHRCATTFPCAGGAAVVARSATRSGGCPGRLRVHWMSGAHFSLVTLRLLLGKELTQLV